MLMKAKAQITLGTDSLASNHQLSIWEEIKTIQQRFPEIELETLLKWGTLNGAQYLGVQEKFGTLEKGKTPGVCWVSSHRMTKSSSVKLL